MQNLPKKILVFENNYDMLNAIKDNIALEGFEAIKCDGVYRANEMWEKHHGSLSGIILDLMIPAYGFSGAQSKRTNKNRATGWIWFIDNVINGNCSRQELVHRTILFSEYIINLKQYVIIANERSDLLELVKKQDKNDPHLWEHLRELVRTL